LSLIFVRQPEINASRRSEMSAPRTTKKMVRSTGTGSSEQLSRRAMIGNLLGAAAAGVAGFPMSATSSAQMRNGEPTGQERGAMNRIAQTFNRQFSVPALSVAVTRNGQFVYDQAFGNADPQKDQLALQSSLFRIASVTKPITSVAIFTLIEKGQLKLNDKVFGPSGVLGEKFGKAPYQQYVTDVTVDNLLTHTSGGWPNDSTDPMFRFNSWDHAKLISWTLQNLPLTYPPGQHWAYSNFGYCVLGRVIEQVSGQPYNEYVQANILAPCGISDMQIARNKENERYPNEVVYRGQYSENPYNMNVTRMDSHGGWVATPSDLVMFLDHVAGVGNIPSLLKPETIRVMTTPTPAYPTGSPAKYARGWMVRQDGAGNWWHTGSLPGSTTIMVRTATGLCWAALTNTRTEPSDIIDTALDQMMWDMVRCVPGWGA
jgi:CubicO group peptidase (beta-lactamase class C family)